MEREKRKARPNIKRQEGTTRVVDTGKCDFKRDIGKARPAYDRKGKHDPARQRRKARSDEIAKEIAIRQVSKRRHDPSKPPRKVSLNRKQEEGTTQTR